MKAREVGSSEWEDADFVTVMINASVGIGEDEYTGSANFGTDDASFWAITSGVPGLGRETDPNERLTQKGRGSYELRLDFFYSPI